MLNICLEESKCFCKYFFLMCLSQIEQWGISGSADESIEKFSSFVEPKVDISQSLSF